MLQSGTEMVEFSSFLVPEGMAFASDNSAKKVYGFGTKYGDDTTSRSIFVLSKSTVSSNWTVTRLPYRKGAPSARIDSVAAVWKNKILIFGGRGRSGVPLKDPK